MKAPHFPFHTVLTMFAALAVNFAAQAGETETVSLILIDGDVRQDWPDPAVVAVHRTGTVGNLLVNFTIGGTAVAGTDFTGPTSSSITIPDGDREAWLEFAPSDSPMSSSSKTITVALEAGSNYTASSVASERLATVTLTNSNGLPGTKEAIRFLNQAAFGPDQDLRNVNEVMRLGFDAWITQEFSKPVGLQQPRKI